MPDPVDLGFAVKLPPREAIDYFRAKGFAISWNWFDTWREAHATAFTVAKATRADVLQTIRDEVDKALAEGSTSREFVKQLTPKLQSLGWWGRREIARPDGVLEEATLGTPWRLQNIYRTNLQSAYMVGRYRAQADNAGSRPYWQYVAVLDQRTRPGHRALAGRVFRHDDPVWDVIYPPNGWGCRCRIRTLSDRQLQSRQLPVESGQGRIGETTREVGLNKATGEVVEKPVRTLRYTDRITGLEETFVPDPGWDYNPGKVNFTPDPSRWKKALALEFKQAVSLKPGPLVEKQSFQSIDEYIEAGRTWTGKIDRAAVDSGQSFQTLLLDTLQAERGIAKAARVASKGSGAALVKRASQHYPDDWTQVADEFGTLQARRMKGRGWQYSETNPLNDGRLTKFKGFGTLTLRLGDGCIAVRPNDFANAIHEYAHRLQSALPALQQHFADLHARRTKGYPLKRLRDLTGNAAYKTNEMTREDKYYQKYQGREYSGAPLEVMTMAFQWVLSGDRDEFEAFRHHDPEMLELVLGLLFHFKP